MDVNDARVLTTVVGLILFIGIVIWTWSSHRRGGFEEAAQLPFLERAAPLPLLDASSPTESAGEKR